MRVFDRKIGRIIGIMCLSLLVFGGCSSNSSLFVKSDAGSQSIQSEVPEALIHPHQQRISMAAGDSLGMQIVCYHPEMVAERMSKMELAYKAEPATF